MNETFIDRATHPDCAAFDHRGGPRTATAGKWAPSRFTPHKRRLPCARQRIAITGQCCSWMSERSDHPRSSLGVSSSATSTACARPATKHAQQGQSNSPPVGPRTLRLLGGKC
jgi:hypothetical protein